MPATFDGFTPGTFAFLRGIAAHNNREWFQANRAAYEEHLLAPAMDLVVALGERLKHLSKDVHAEPRINGSIMRINRDTRFSKDKRPYKDHLDLWFWEGKDRKGPGFWFRVTPERLMLGAGMHLFEKDLLERYRRAVVDPRRGPALQRAVDKLRAAGYDIGGTAYKRVPSGFEAAHPRAGLLLHGGLYAGIDTKLPAEARGAKFPDLCFAHYKTMAPLQEWLVDLVYR